MLAAAEDHPRAADSAVIGSDRMALGLFAEPDGLAAKAIAALGVTEPQVRAALGAPEQSAAGPADDAANRIPLARGRPRRCAAPCAGRSRWGTTTSAPSTS